MYNFFSQEVKRLSTVLACQEPCDAHKYAYVANVCVSKFAQRQGIASNMLYLATDVATLSGTRFSTFNNFKDGFVCYNSLLLSFL